MYCSCSRSVAAHFDKQVEKTGQKDLIEERILGPKEVRDTEMNSPEAKVRKDCTLDDADTDMTKIEVIPKDFADI